MTPKAETYVYPEPKEAPHRDLLLEFFLHLKRTGASQGRLDYFRSPIRHFLIWLDATATRLDTVNDDTLRQFRHHHCQCIPLNSRNPYKKSSRQSRTNMSAVVGFIRYLEDSGRISHPGELDEGFRLHDEFLCQLSHEGYGDSALGRYRSRCRHFLVWLHQNRLSLSDVTPTVIRGFLEHDCVCSGRFTMRLQRSDGLRSREDARIDKFVEFLASRGRVRRALPTSPKIDPKLASFQSWLRKYRALSESTIETHTTEVAALLIELGDDPSRLDAEQIRTALVRVLKNRSRNKAKAVTSSLRMYLRFLVSKGDCSPSLIGATPTIPSWRLSTIPRYISTEEIERVIVACDITVPVQLRDRAILLLLARLGLRAGDIVHLGLTDLDWKNGQIQVCGKSKQAARLPLPQDAGDALLDYIERVRPRLAEDRVFLRSLAPHRPLASSSSISCIVDRALTRAGVDGASVRGAYLFRHSAATGLLRSGASLEMVGALLRHRHPETTAIYAKVDIPMLQGVVQPWIGEVR